MTVYSEENQNAGLIVLYRNTNWWIPLTYKAKVRLKMFFRAINHVANNGLLRRARFTLDEAADPLLKARAREKGFTLQFRNPKEHKMSGKTEDQISPFGRGGKRKYW
jgi:hypothetical protein